MKKLNKVAMLFATAALAAPLDRVRRHSATVDNWAQRYGGCVWKNGTNELCWRDAIWTPATGLQGCDGALKPPPPPAPAPRRARAGSAARRRLRRPRRRRRPLRRARR